MGLVLVACTPAANESIEAATAVPAMATITEPTPSPPTAMPEVVDETTAVARATAPLAINPQTYDNAELGFSLQHDASWQLEAQDDSSVLAVTLRKQGYELQLRVRPQTDENLQCGGLLSADNDSSSYWQDTIAEQEWWRPKAEAGFSNGYHDDAVTFLEIISPIVLYEQPTAEGYLGEFTCLLPVQDKWVTVNYLLPISSAQLAAGQYDATILGELDNIVASLVFQR